MLVGTAEQWRNRVAIAVALSDLRHTISKLFTDNNKAKYDSLIFKAQKSFAHGVTFFSGFTLESRKLG